MPNTSFYRLEQLAKLGLPKQIFIPALLQELHHSIPSISNTYCWINSKGLASNIYDESLSTKIIEHFIAVVTDEALNASPRGINWLNQLNKISVISKLTTDKTAQLFQFHDKVLKPMGYINSCFVPVISQINGEHLGVLILHRQENGSPFLKKEQEDLAEIASIIAMGYETELANDIYSLSGWQQGMLIVNQEGKLQHGCAMGLKLLAMASSSQFNQQTNQLPHDLHSFDGYAGLIKAMSEPHHLRTGVDPTLTIANAWGEFKLRAFLIDDLDGKRSPQIGINIGLQEPFILKLFHRIKTVNLTPRQESVALAYAAGDSFQTISIKLNISFHTVKDHIKNICERLNVKTRADLVTLILCDRTFSNNDN